MVHSRTVTDFGTQPADALDADNAMIHGTTARRVLLLATVLAAPVASARGQAPVAITRTTQPVRIDGRPDEAAWLGVAPFPLIQQSPTAGAPATEASEVRLIYDDQYLYASGIFHTANARTIRPGLFTRDQMGGEDHFMVILDAANDNQTGFVFTVAPSGAKTDFAVGGDGASLDRNWNGFWDAAASRDSAGWYAEMRIPLSSLRFQRIGNSATMGLIIHRYTSVTSEFDTYPNLPSNFANGLFRSSIAQKIQLQAVKARSPLYLTPYALAGRSSVASLTPGAPSYDRVGTNTTELGIDAKFGLTSSLAVDLTANTDFAQVEADNQQVNLTRFSLFFPEKRQFFLERADLFAVGGGQGDLLFNSRRIGLSAAGEALRIFGGARVVGRVGAWDVGALSMQTATAAGHGTENDAAVRLRRSFLNSGSYFGGLLTSRIGGDRGNDYLLSGDAVVRPFGNDFITAQAATSSNAGTAATATDQQLYHVIWERRSAGGLQYTADVRHIGKDFEPSLGFQSRNGIGQAMLYAGYGWRPGARTLFSAITPSVMVDLIRRNDDHVVDTKQYVGALNVNFKSGWYAGAVIDRTIESLDQGFHLSPTASVPAGDYSYGSANVTITSNRRSKLSASIFAKIGQLYDGTQRSISFSPSWNASEHFQLELTGTVTRVRFPSRDESLDADLARLRLQYALNAKLSAAAFVQYNRLAQTTAANVRVRYQLAEGRDFWVVYNDLLNVERDPTVVGQPQRPLSQAHTLLVKYTQTFTR